MSLISTPSTSKSGYQCPVTMNNVDNEMYLKFAGLKVTVDKELDRQHIEKILQNGFDINYQVPSHLIGISGVNGMTVLHLAQQDKRIDILNLFLNHGADFTLKNSQGSTALHKAMEKAFEYETFRLLQDTRDFSNLILFAHISSKNSYNPCNNNGISHFHAACTANNVDAVRFFLDNGVSVDQAIDANSSILPGYTALHIAVAFYNLETVDILLQYNVNVHAKDSEGKTAVHLCLKQKLEISNLRVYEYSSALKAFHKWKLDISDKILNLMLQKYIPIDDTGLSHLQISSTMVDSAVAIQLLEQNVNIDHALNMDSPIFAGYTALHFAVQCNMDAVKLLIAKGANMLLKDSKGWSSLDLCLERYNVEEVHSMFLCHPVWKDIILTDKKTKLIDLICASRDSDEFETFKQKVHLNEEMPLISSDSPLWPGYTLLHLSVTMSNERDELCLAPMDVMISDSHGSTPIHLVVQKEKYIVSKVFISMIHNQSECENIVNEDNLSHLHCICARRLLNLDIIEKLLFKNETTGTQSHVTYTGPTVYGVSSGSTPLHVAVSRKSLSYAKEFEAIKLLVEHGADVHAVDAQGFTPIHRLLSMCGHDCKNVGAMLLSTPDLKDCVVNGIGLSHLHVASLVDDVQSVEKLLDRGADINARISPKLPTEISFLEKYAGFTALHMAVKQNNKNVLDFLLRHGADIFVKHADGLPLLYEILSSTQGNHLNLFENALKSNYTFQRKFNEETGLTMFHVACHKLDVDLMQHYLSKTSTNINAQAFANSPIWPGFTALHIVRNRMRLPRHPWDTNLLAKDKLKNDVLADDALAFLLSYGADVTIADANGKTPLHLFFQNMVTGSKEDYARVSLVLKAQKNLGRNPVDSDGTSHFHIACGMNDFPAVKQFLESHGDVDVNKTNNRGDTPLHLSTGSSVVKFSASGMQLKIIQLLLKRGAEINVKNNLGNTPLHEVASGHSSVVVRVFEILLKAGADPKAENIFHETPLELLCKSKTITAKNLSFFTQFGCNINTFNPVTNEGFIGLILHTTNQSSKWDSIRNSLLKLPETRKVDASGRSFIHNVVSLKGHSYETFRDKKADFLKLKLTYKKFFEYFWHLRWDIDIQDNEGKTPLHTAAKFSNIAAVSALIEFGSDLNVIDKTGRTPLAYAFEPYSRSKYSILDSNGQEVNKILLEQIIILRQFDLHVCRINEDILIAKSKIEDFPDIKIHTYLVDQAKNKKIGDSLTLRRFLSEDYVAAYAYTSPLDRQAIRTFVKYTDNNEFRDMMPAIKLQLRRAENRVDLVKEATGSLRSLLNAPVPDLCTRIIFETLKNSDLQNLILAATENA